MNHQKIKSQTLLYVGLVFLIIVAVAAAVVISSTGTLKSAFYQRKSQDAYQLAMAGIERAKVELNNDWDWPGMDINIIDSDPNRGTPDDETASLGQGQYWVWLEDISPNEIRVVSHGWVEDAYRIIEVHMQGAPPQPPQIDIPNCYADNEIDVALEHTLVAIPGYAPVNIYTGSVCWKQCSCGTPFDTPPCSHRFLGPCFATCLPCCRPCSLDLNDDPASRLYACNMIGFGSVESFATHIFANPCDNPVYEFNGTRWIADESAPGWGGNGRCTDQLCCREDSRLPRCSNNRDDDGDGFIDFDGLDVNGDGDVTDPEDYQPDPDCDDALDEDERTATGGGVTIIPDTWKEL